MLKWKEEFKSQARNGFWEWHIERQESSKARPFVPNSHVVITQEMLLKEIKSATPVNTWIIRKQNSLIAVKEKVLVVWIEASHNILFNQSLIQTKSSYILWSPREVRKLQKKSLKLPEIGLWGCRKKAFAITEKFKVKQQVLADLEAAANYLWRCSKNNTMVIVNNRFST